MLALPWHVQRSRRWLQLGLAGAAGSVGKGGLQEVCIVVLIKIEVFLSQVSRVFLAGEEGWLRNGVICPAVKAAATSVRQGCAGHPGQTAKGGGEEQSDCEAPAHLLLPEGEAVIKGNSNHSVCATQGLVCRKHGFALPCLSQHITLLYPLVIPLPPQSRL